MICFAVGSFAYGRCDDDEVYCVVLSEDIFRGLPSRAAWISQALHNQIKLAPVLRHISISCISQIHVNFYAIYFP